MIIGVVGLGYVGLTLAAALGRRFDTIGLDQDGARVEDCRRLVDRTGLVAEAELRAATRLRFTTDFSASATRASSSSPCPRPWMPRASRTSRPFRRLLRRLLAGAHEPGRPEAHAGHRLPPHGARHGRGAGGAVHDPRADAAEALRECGVSLSAWEGLPVEALGYRHWRL